MKILVTGGSGYVGSCLVPVLLKRGYHVKVLDNLLYDQIQLLPYFIDKKFEFNMGDIRDERKTKDVIKDVDVIVHLASIVGAPACKKNSELANDINVNGTKTLMKHRSKRQIVIYASTGSVYGKIEEVCNEEVIPKPLSVYGQTKLKAEEIVFESGPSVALRFATAFGLAPRLRLDLLPNDFVLNALKNKYLVIYDKNFRRTFIHVTDIVRSYIFAIDHFIEMKNEAYNIGS